MRSKDEFVSGYYLSPKTFDEIFEEYNDLTRKLSVEKEKKKKYDEILGDDRTITFYGTETIIFASLYTNYLKCRYEGRDYGFNNYHKLNQTIWFLIHKNREEEFKKYGFDLRDIAKELENNSKELFTYNYIKWQIDGLESSIRDILDNHISFDCLNKHSCGNGTCKESGHTFIRLNDEIKCVYCGATTKDYDLSKEELDFLTACVKRDLWNSYIGEDLSLHDSYNPEISNEKVKK